MPNCREPPNEGNSRAAACRSSSALLPGLPDDLAILCLARVPSLSLLWRVCPSWQAILSQSNLFHSLRLSLGFKPQQWLYALLHNTDVNGGHVKSPSQNSGCGGNTAPTFSWKAFDPLANCWHCLPPFLHPVEFQLTSPSFIGLLHSVQCVSSATKLFMVAGSRRRGGRNINSSNTSSLEDPDRRPLEPALDCPFIFDTQTGKWTQGAPFSVPRKWCACGTVADKLIIASGCGRDWDLTLSKSAEMYDPEAGKWVTLDHLKSSKFSGEAISAVNYEGKLHMVSGKGVGVIYDPKTGKWVEMPKGMRNGWNGPSVVVDGKLLVVESSTGRLKAYDGGEDCWTSVMEEEILLKNMEQLMGGVPGKFCGIVRGRHGSSPNQQDVIRIVDIHNKPTVTDLRPPFGQIVALQVLSRASMGLFESKTEKGKACN